MNVKHSNALKKSKEPLSRKHKPSEVNALVSHRPATPTTRKVKTSRLGFRASESQETVIRLASNITNKSLTDFIMDSTYQAAENVLLEQRLFMISEEKYQTFVEILNRPAQDNEGLKKLFLKQSPWD